MKNVLVYFIASLLIVACSETKKENIDSKDEDSMVLKESEEVSEAKKKKLDWNEVSITSPIVEYDEVKSKEIQVRGNEKHSVYSIDENILFDTDKAVIRKSGEEKLKEVITSLKKRYPDGEIAVKGYTDSRGSKPYNKELSEDRAEAVADFIQQNSDIQEDRISIIAKGEKNPVSTNETEEGRQDNRRVEIMVRG